MNATTTYGLPSNEWHGLQFQITNDGRYVMTMSPYYHYGSGMKMYVIDSVTGEYRRGWNNSTGYSMCVAPFGANDITFNYNHNSDSITTRVSAGRMSFEQNFHSYKLDNYNQGGNGIAYGPGDGGQLIGNFAYHNGMFDITQHTTNYPRLYQVIPGALTIAEVESYRGPVIDDWSKVLQFHIATMIDNELPNDIQEIKSLHARSDWPGVEKIAHRLKGGLVYCGADRLACACQYLERYKKAGLSAMLEELYQQLLIVADETLLAIMKWLG